MLSKEFDMRSLANSAIQIDDLVTFYRKLHYKDGGPRWEFMLERSIPGMTYQAWRRDPQHGPTEYRTQHVFKNVTPIMMKDFFWDDEHRHEWDSLIRSARCIEGCFETGENVSHWIKKFPFFVSDRDYVLGRRIFECEDIFYCITKAVPSDNVPLEKRLRRVSVYSSCWSIQAVESPDTGQKTDCEVIFIHSEDLLIQRDLAKLGVRRAMWPLVKRMEPGLRKYEAFRKASSTLSLSASLAQIITRISSSVLEESDHSGGLRQREGRKEEMKKGHASAWKWIAIGGAVAMAFHFGKGPVGKVFLLGLSRNLRR
ncbi:hypothetical protein KP509_29G043900 [Ceratopteris richardii]|nr:hypothetical protein KP509_29G043900 [Ceratopteris richardii]